MHVTSSHAPVLTTVEWECQEWRVVEKMFYRIFFTWLNLMWMLWVNTGRSKYYQKYNWIIRLSHFIVSLYLIWKSFVYIQTKWHPAAQWYSHRIANMNSVMSVVASVNVKKSEDIFEVRVSWQYRHIQPTPAHSVLSEKSESHCINNTVWLTVLQRELRQLSTGS